MERGKKMMKMKKKKKIGKHKCQSSTSASSERSPLQELKRVPTTTNTTTTTMPSSSTSVSVEAPRGCLRFLLSANSNFSSSSSSSSSSTSSASRKPQAQRKPKSFSKLGNKSISTTPMSAPNSTRLRSNASKENDLPGVASKNPKKNPSFLSQWQSGKKPSLKASQASKLSSTLCNSLKGSASGSQRFGSDRKDLKQKEQEKNGSASGQPTDLFSFKVSNDLNSIENCTPVGKLPCWSALDSSIFSDDKPVGGDSNSANTKTPPIEASVSPEIQSGVSNLLVPAATPISYGVGHLLSGVTDKRKCRPRGILTIGGDMNIDESASEETNVCVDHGNEIATEILAKPRPSFIPLPTEASMKWLSSPQGENDQKCDSAADQCMTLLSSSSIGLPFSPSDIFPSDLLSDSEETYQSSNFDATGSSGKTRIVLLSPRRTPNFQGSSGPSPNVMDVHLFSAIPQSKSSHDINCPPQEGNFSYRSIGDSTVGEKSPSSTGFFSSGNVVQTPKSDSSSGRLIDISQIEADNSQRNKFDLQVDAVAESLDRMSSSPGIHTLKWDPPGLNSQFTDLCLPSHSVNDLGSCASWVSDSMSQNVSLSHMRISWREGLVSRISDTDEFDCCRCLSDEEKDIDQSDKLPTESSPKPFESVASEQQNPFGNDGLRSPEFLEQEPRILGKGKEKLSLAEHYVCAESISTDGGGLVSSGESDWTLCYKNHLFEV